MTNRISVVPGGKTDVVMAQIGPGPVDPLAGLPGGPFAFAVGGVVPVSVLRPLADFQGDMMKAMRKVYGLSDEQIKQYQDTDVQVERSDAALPL